MSLCTYIKNKAPLGYITAVFEVRKLLALIKPDIINAHYATGYIFLARLIGYKPLMLSVLGSHIYDFPGKFFFHRAFLKGNLKLATSIGSTSNSMAKKCKRLIYIRRYIAPLLEWIIFSFSSTEIREDDNKIVVGTV
jgi:hypothetical protein